MRVLIKSPPATQIPIKIRSTTAVLRGVGIFLSDMNLTMGAKRKYRRPAMTRGMNTPLAIFRTDPSSIMAMIPVKNRITRSGFKENLQQRS
jgi:hypothetical protein